MTTNDKIKAFWAFAREHYPALLRIAQSGGEANSRDRAVGGACLDRLRQIHPDLQMRLFASGESPRVCIHLPIRERAYLLFVAELIRKQCPRDLVSQYEVLCGDRVSAWLYAGTLGAEQGSYRQDIYLHLYRHEGNVLALYSESLDLYNPEVYERVYELIEADLGEGFCEFYVDRVEVLDALPPEGVSLETFLQNHLASGEELLFFPPIPFNPLENPCSYHLDGEAKALRGRGRIAYDKLLHELWDLSSKDYGHHSPCPNISAWGRVGLKVYTLVVHISGDDGFAVREQESALMGALVASPVFETSCLLLGKSISREEDYFFVDLLCSDSDALIPILEGLARERNCLIQLIEQGEHPERRLRTLFDVRDLPLLEMEARNAPSTYILDKLAGIPDKDKSVEYRLIEARAYNGMGRFDEAIRLFESCQADAPTDPRRFFGLACAHRGLALADIDAGFDLACVAYDYYQRSWEAGHRVTECRCLQAELLFTFQVEGIEVSHDLGLRLLREARQDEEMFDKYKDLFYDFDQCLSPEDEEALDALYRARYGEPTCQREVLSTNGHRFLLQFYQDPSLGKDCTFVLTRGLSSTRMGDARFVYRAGQGMVAMEPYRMELLLALPPQMGAEDFMAEADAWLVRVSAVCNEQVFIPQAEELDADTFQAVAFRIKSLEHHPYRGHHSFRYVLPPRSVFVDDALSEALVLPSGAKIDLVGLTPIYDEEYEFFKQNEAEDCERLGLWRLSPLYEVGRPSLCPRFETEEIDLDDLLGGSPQFSAES